MKKLIVIHGPSCAGKSTIIDILFTKYQSIFWLKFDAIKRFFVDYDPLRDKEKVSRLVVLIGQNRIDKDEDILCENAFPEILSYAQEHGYRIFEYNIEAPYSVLLERFYMRVETNKHENLKINTSFERHRDIYEKYLLNKNQHIETFDTSNQSAEEIAEHIFRSIA